jgi:predicted DNA-binding ribbon-helix-helix protein
LGGRKTSVTPEDAFWHGLKEIAHRRQMTLSDLIGAIDAQRRHSTLASAIRLFLRWVRQGAFVLGDLAEIAAINPAAAGGAANEMLGIVLRRVADELARRCDAGLTVNICFFAARQPLQPLLWYCLGGFAVTRISANPS